MPCPHRRNAIKVLMGELGPEASSRMLEHCRVCGECREAFDFGAATIARTASKDAVPSEGGAAPAGRVAPLLAMSGAGPNAVRRNRGLLIVFGVAALALFLAGIGKGGGGAPAPGDPAPETLWRMALSGGTPVVQSPAGSFDARPRVITALVPPGSGPFGVTILDQAGKVVFQGEEKPGERGCFVEEGAITAPGGGFRAGRLVVPFPGEDALSLEAGRSYGVLVTVAGGHASAASAFQVARTAGTLHGAPVEER